MANPTKTQLNQARRLVDRAWAAGLQEATTSQIAKDLEGWTARIEQAETEQATSAADPTEPADDITPP